MLSLKLISSSPLLQPLWGIIVNEHWEPGIGDPTFMGWITVIIYLISASLCFWAAWRTAQLLALYRFQHYYWLWLGLGFSLIILGLNKQLDLQSWLTVFGKKIAIAQGWYVQRRFVQLAFITGIICLLVSCFISLRRLIQQDWKIFRLTFIGFLFLSGFILIRATSFHHIDQLIGINFAGFRLNWLLEISGLVCIGLSCINYLKYLKHLRPNHE